MNKELKDWLERVNESSGKNIKESGCFMSIFTQNFKDNPQCAFELGLAILHDKPIILLADKNTWIPPVLHKLAERIELYDGETLGDFERASKSLFDFMQSRETKC